MEYLGAWETMIHEKNLKPKISCQTPFKYLDVAFRGCRKQFRRFFFILLVDFFQTIQNCQHYPPPPAPCTYMYIVPTCFADFCQLVSNLNTPHSGIYK